MNLDSYGYFLPEKNLALSPAVPRDSSKLFVYNTKTDEIIFDYFYNIDKYLPKDSFMVLNNTKVLPARVTMNKENGGKVVLLFLVNELTSLRVGKALTDRKINVGEKIFFDQENYLEIISQKENIFDLRFNFSREHLFELLNKYGTMPIPPYLKKSPLKKDELLKKYQTIFAKIDGSAAAPTASLHFTDSVFNKLNKKEIKKLFVTLHVGLGTFAPISDENIKQKKLHNEYYEVDKKTLQCIDTSKQEGKKLVAVGTTVVRTLESIARQHVFSSATQLSLLSKTDLFIFPPYNFKLVDIMITNFHLPKSSLMMLVEAFLQYKKSRRSLVELYSIAIKNNFRFYSFGDAMMII
ncbi:tRNA preQ1(34) S-adenosylmethionine ribosyltransferase-isomerase QueA [Candidatus Roizmanbacteria bacterium CG07_land_8_20_14_0_80_34_15]|nr:MAG: tRNA preQ1(34) S-adenosylmethionine ribosyltransferase-isomerase QueA [Candidatus Roizmanbacteria bacterium CG07_land_8_20_14_0_80_34_15]